MPTMMSRCFGGFLIRTSGSMLNRHYEGILSMTFKPAFHTKSGLKLTR